MMTLKKLLIALGCFFFLGITIQAQTVFSLGTNVSLFRNTSPQQKFWTVGQYIEGYAHFSKKESGYAWINYATESNFKNTFSAVAKDPQTVPSSLNYTINSKWRFNQFSLGWKHYIKGSFDNEASWNLYSLVGFGLAYVHIDNTYESVVDTTLYSAENLPSQGSNTYKKLTFDLGLGVDYALGSDLYLYGDVRAWLPASDKTSTYLINNKNAPQPIIFSVGIRILFSHDYE